MRYEILDYKQEETLKLRLTTEDIYFLWCLDKGVNIKTDDDYIYSISYEELIDRFSLALHKCSNEEVKKRKIRKLFNGPLKQVINFICYAEKKYLFSVNLEIYKKIIA